MAKDKKKFTLPQSKYLNEHGDETFILVAMPQVMIDKIDVVRDAVITYMPGYDKKDFEVLRTALDWIDNIEQLLCVREEPS